MTVLNESQHVCVVGIGDMGSALAEVLLDKGHKVTVWNRTAAKARARSSCTIKGVGVRRCWKNYLANTRSE
jgi:3-hydroxyisobutyrate dehydrogenase-like beta-hydroxyacid dehydrogenase